MHHEPPAPARIGIAVLTWRAEALTRRCVEQLRTLPAGHSPTLIVDSASGTGEGERIASTYGLDWIELPDNGGVPAGYNAAGRWALQRGLDHVLLLNNDLEFPDPELITKLLAAAGAGIAAVGPRVLDRDGTPFSYGGIVDLRTGVTGHLRRPLKLDGSAYDVAWIDGCCMLVATDALMAVGGLAPEYFMYWEEVDWCIRARSAHLRCRVVPSASVLHHRGTATPGPNVVLGLRRNSILFMRRNGSGRQNAQSLVHFVTLGLVKRLVDDYRLRASWSLELVATARAVGWNVRDAIRQGRWRLPADGPQLSRSSDAVPREPA